MQFVFGLVLGILVLRLRAPEGFDLLQLPAVEPRIAGLVRAQALAAAGLIAAWLPERVLDGRPHAGLLIGLATGGLLGCLSSPIPTPAWGVPAPATAQAIALALLLLAALVGCRWRERTELGETPPGPPKANALLVLATAGAGAGAALAAEPLARHSNRLTLGTRADEAVIAATFLAGLAFGGLAFGRMLAAMRDDRARGATAALAAALAGPLALLSLRSTALITRPRGLRDYVRRFGLDTSDAGTLAFDVLVALPSLLPVAFAIGTALFAARERRLLVALCVGGALGTALAPLRLEAMGVVDLLAGETGSASLARDGTWLCAGAAALCLLSRARVAGLVVASLAATAAALLPTPALPTPQSWQRFRKEPVAVLECAAGQLLVQPGPRGGLSARLDQRVIAVGMAALEEEHARARAAVDLLGAGPRRDGVQVLLVGQLDPARSAALLAAGATRVDATAAWWPAMERLEQALFVGGAKRMPGEVLSPQRAQERLAARAYDLVLVPSVPGSAPLATVTVPRGTPALAWIEGAGPMAWADQHEHLAVTVTGLPGLALGWVWNATAPDEVRLDPSPESPWLMHWLQRRDWEREGPSLEVLCGRLARGNPAWSEVFEALGEFHAMQRHSSPFESQEQATELEERVLARISHAARGVARAPLMDRVVTAFAEVLAGKRDIAGMYDYIEPVSISWGRPPHLELLLARADLESLLPQAAVERLTPLIERHPGDGRVARALAEALDAAHRPGEAVAIWTRVLRLNPGDPQVQRKRALALARAGDPAGVRLLEAMLLETPDDPELQQALDVGPLAPPEPEFVPETGRHDH